MTRLELPRRRNEWPERQLPGSSPEKPGRGRCELRITPPGWSVAQRSRGVQSRCPRRQLRSRQFAPSPQPGLESSTSRTSDVRAPPTGSGPTRFPCLKRLLEQLAEGHSVCPGETTEAFTRLVADPDAQLLPSRRHNARRASWSFVRRRRRLHGRRHSPLSAIVITCAVTFRAAGEQRKSASPATSSMST